MTTPDFILGLRRKIGHDPLWLTGVVGLVMDDEGHVLLGKRSDSGQWALISGIVEPGEQPADTLVREFKEETGVDVTASELVAVTSEPHPYALGNDDQVHFMNLLFLCDLTPQGVRISSTPDGENEETGWFDLAALPQPMQPMSLERLRLFHRYLARHDDGKSHALFFSDGQLH